MLLRNKKTGEIRSCQILADGFIVINSLKDLEQWEDYKKPTGYCYVRDGGNVDYNPINSSIVRRHKEIGNYFETEEEAEKAVEKLKALKRLKDKGFRFTGIQGISNQIHFDISSPYSHIAYDEYLSDEKQKEYNQDLHLLFGGN